MRSFVARLAVGLSVAVAPLAATAAAPLIPRAVLFAGAERFVPLVSPDAKILAYVAPDKDGVPQLWLRNVGKENDRAVTSDRNAGLRLAAWAHDGRTLLFYADPDGRGAWHIFGFDVPTSNLRDYTPFRGVEARIVALSPKVPREMLVGLNLRDRRYHDVFRVQLESGAVIPEVENPGDVQRFFADANLTVKLAMAATPSGGVDLRSREDDRSMWRSIAIAGPEDVLAAHGLTADGKRAVVVTSLGTDTAIVVEKDIVTGKETVVVGRPEADVDDVLLDPTTGAVQAAAVAPDRRHWYAVDKRVEADFQGISRLADGDFSIVGRDAADKVWVVGMAQDRGPARYYLWDRTARKGSFLFSDSKRLEGLQLAAQKPVSFKARDGLAIGGYLSVPVGSSGKGLPLVLLVHPGPWSRDTWGYEPRVQWLANRGYAVLQVNYRGSSGFGKKFREAGYRQWGGTMQNDLTDAVAWAVKEGVADPKKVAIAGSGYGGYAALAGLTLTPDLFAAAVADSAPSSLETVITSIPSSLGLVISMFKQRVGDPARDGERMAQASPVRLADRIKAPLFLAEADNDPRAKADADRLVAGLDKRGAKLVYVVYADERGQIAMPQNELDLAARAEIFLARHLGGRAEPLPGDREKGSTAIVKVSRD